MDKQQALKFYDAVEKAQALREQAADLENEALRRAGWEYTSSTPSSVWMWKKQFNGQTFLVDRELALSLQQGEAFLATM